MSPYGRGWEFAGVGVSLGRKSWLLGVHPKIDEATTTAPIRRPHLRELGIIRTLDYVPRALT